MSRVALASLEKGEFNDAEMATAAREPLARAPQDDVGVAHLAQRVACLAVASMGLMIIDLWRRWATLPSTLDALTGIIAGLRDCDPEDESCNQNCYWLAGVVVFSMEVASVVSCLCGFCVLCCGYQGAKTSNRSMMCCFCGLNLLDVIAAVCSTSLFVILAHGGGVLGDYAGHWTSKLQLVILAFMLCLRGGSFWYGCKLYVRLGQCPVTTAAPVYPAMTVVQVQPGDARPGQPGDAA